MQKSKRKPDQFFILNYQVLNISTELIFIELLTSKSYFVNLEKEKLLNITAATSILHEYENVRNSLKLCKIMQKTLKNL